MPLVRKNSNVRTVKFYIFITNVIKRMCTSLSMFAYHFIAKKIELIGSVYLFLSFTFHSSHPKSSLNDVQISLQVTKMLL